MATARGPRLRGSLPARRPESSFEEPSFEVFNASSVPIHRTSAFGSVPTELCHAPLLDRKLEDELFDTIWLKSRVASLIRSFLKEFANKNVMVKTSNGWPADAETVHAAMKVLAKDIRTGTSTKAEPAWIFIGCSENLEPDEVIKAARVCFPETINVHCCTSCQGVTTDTGFKANVAPDGATKALAVFAVFDPLGSYATVGYSAVDGKTTTAEMLHGALDNAYKELRSRSLDIFKDQSKQDNETPSLEPLAENLKIWMSGMPGTEEVALEALYEWSHSRFSRTVPVVGGTSADGSIAGKWRVFANQVTNTQIVFGQDKGQGLIFTLIGSSVKVFPLFMHPFTPMTQFTARVLSAGSGEENKEKGGRVIQYVRDEKGHEMAAGSWYYRCCEEQIQKRLMPPPESADGPMAFNPGVLAASTACPLGVAVARDGDDAFDYRMLHPSGIYFFEQNGRGGGDKDAYLKAFASVDSDITDLVLFKARRGDLLARLDKFKEQLVLQIDRASDGKGSVATDPDALRGRLAGVIMVYCAGCMMAVNSGKDGSEQMRRLTMYLSNCFVGRPFMAYHPFGEQGYYRSKDINHHGNLMFAALAFSKDPSVEIDETLSVSEMIMPILQRFSSSGKQDYVRDVLIDLLSLCDRASFEAVGTIVHANAITPTLLQEIAPCATRPVNFALNVAYMFKQLAKMHALKANLYLKASQWFIDFTGDFMESAPWNLLNGAQLLDEETLMLGVHMATTIDAKSFVASRAFQELMEKVWTTTSNISEAAKLLIDEENLAENHDGSITSPKVRHYMNSFALLVLACLQVYTSQFDDNNLHLWLICLLFSSAHLLQMMASPSTGFYTWISTLDDVFIVIAHSTIVYRVSMGEEVPRDLDAVTIFLHFANFLKGCTIHPMIGPLIITLFTMIGDIQRVFGLMIFFGISFSSCFHALYRGFEPNYTGNDFSPLRLLIDAVWGNQVIWTVEGESSQSLFASLVTGWTDSTSLNGVGFCLIMLAILTIPILLLNLMIAMMASSYAQVEKDVDVEYKVQFAACTLVARKLSPLPIPFSLPIDLGRVVQKRFRRLRHDVATLEVTPDQYMSRQLAVTQLMAQWEARMSVSKLKGVATTDQQDRMRMQIDSLQDRMHVLYNAVLLIADKMAEGEDRMQVQLKSTLGATHSAA